MKKSTTTETNKQDNRSTIAELIKQISGQNNTLAIPRIYIKLTGDDHLAALLLSQCVYWSDKGHSDGGWFAKSYQEWYEELGMTRYQVKRAAAKLEAFGLMTGLHRSTYHKGGATLHYRVDIDLLINLIVKSVDSQQTLQSDLQQTSISDLQEGRKSDHRLAESKKPKNKRDSSPKGDGPPAKEDSPSKSSKRDAYNDLVEAAVVAFKTSPAYARKIVAFLRNTLSDTDNRGRANDAWIEYMTEPKREITPALIRGFGQYWLTRHSDVSRPSSPEAIANNWHRYLMDESQAQFEKDGQLAIDLAAAKAAQAAAAAAVETETAATAATDGKVGTVEEQNAIFDRLLEAMRRFTE